MFVYVQLLYTEWRFSSGFRYSLLIRTNYVLTFVKGIVSRDMARVPTCVTMLISEVWIGRLPVLQC